jgi:hypothetical protein
VAHDIPFAPNGVWCKPSGYLILKKKINLGIKWFFEKNTKLLGL